MPADHGDDRFIVLSGFSNGESDAAKTGAVERLLWTGQFSDLRLPDITAAFFQAATLQSGSVKCFVAAHSTGSIE
ncbi:MAG: hypothetical protein ACKVHE_35280 [Planctomycetales bacterium]|jgi:hypothetical protein